MKPHVITLSIKCMDKKEQVLEVVGNVPYSEVDNMVFLSIPKDVEITKECLSSLSFAASSTGKTFIIVPPGTELLEITEKWESKKD